MGKNEIIGYTVGFMFSEDEQKILLLQRKSKPGLEWMKGKWNGIGGHIEKDETPAVCMAREFEEEAGIKTDPSDWIEFAVLSGEDYNVYCFFTHYENLSEFETKEDQKVAMFGVEGDLYSTAEEIIAPVYTDIELMPNLKYLIPLALNCRGTQLPVWFFGAVGEGD